MAFWSPDGLRKSRFHDEKGNLVDAGWLWPAAFAFGTAAAKRLFGFRLQRPMISIRATDQLAAFLRKDFNAVEFGSGMSTPWLAKRCGFLLSVEDHREWAGRVRQMLAKLGTADNVRYELRSRETYADLSGFPDGHFHFALIDGSDRRHCVRSVLPKMVVGGVIYLDNSDKDAGKIGDLSLAEELLLETANSHDWPVRVFTDFSPTNFFVEQGVMVTVTSAYGGAAPQTGLSSDVTLSDGRTVTVTGLLAKHVGEGRHDEVAQLVEDDLRLGA